MVPRVDKIEPSLIYKMVPCCYKMVPSAVKMIFLGVWEPLERASTFSPRGRGVVNRNIYQQQCIESKQRS